MRRMLGVLLLLSTLIAPGVALAQQTGAIGGQVVDVSGAPVAGATVRLSGNALPAPRSVTTSEDGRYRLAALAPGTYNIEAEKTGVGRISGTIVASSEHDTTGDFILGSQVTVKVAVTSTSPDVNLKSTEVSFSYKRDFIQDLPLERSYMGLLQLVPGIAENGTFAPSGGGSRQDNTYLIDGANITNPLFGYLATEVNELDIAELHVKRGAITAESGRSQGFVTNVVTRSGTNRLAGAYRFEAIPGAWIQESDKQVRSSTDRWINAVGVGGPLVRNKLFVYGSGRVFRSTAARAANFFGPLPDTKDKTHEVFGKITVLPLSSAVLNASYRHRPSRNEFADIGAEDSPSVGTNGDGTNRILTLAYDWFTGNRTTISARFVHMDENAETHALTDLGFQPAFDPFGLAAMGHVRVGGLFVGGTDRRLNQQNYRTDELRLTASRAFDVGRFVHLVKIGYGWSQGKEDLTRRSNGWGDLSPILITYNGATRAAVRALYYPEQPSQLSRGRTDSLFVQDDFALSTRLTVNAGLLLTRDQFIQDAPDPVPGVAAPVFEPGPFLTFGFGEQLQPRLGVNYQLRSGQDDKVYLNWGRFYGLDQKSGARSMATARLYQEIADFDALTGELLVKRVAPGTASKEIAAGTRPPYMDEILVGYATPLSDGWTLDAFFLHRDTDDFIEDIPTALPESGFHYANDPVADRQYKTFVVELNRALRDRWAMNASYAWSRLSGNFDLDYDLSTQVFNTASLINDGPGTFTADRLRQGVLSQDRTHVFKVLATWTPEWIEDLTLGLFMRTQSGTPWEARGLSWPSGVQLVRLLEPLGRHRTPMWTNVDLAAKYGIRLGGRRVVRFEGRLLNVFNQETALRVNVRRYDNARNNSNIVNPPPDSCLSCWTDAYTAQQLTNQTSTTFGQPIAYAPQRRFLFSLLFDF
jgi:hypothetical protein